MQAGVQTGFEQFQDVFATLGLSASYDDLQTTDSASESLKKQAGQFSELAANYGFSFDRRNRAFMPTDGYITKFNQKGNSQFLQIETLFLIVFHQAFINSFLKM